MHKRIKKIYRDNYNYEYKDLLLVIIQFGIIILHFIKVSNFKVQIIEKELIFSNLIGISFIFFGSFLILISIQTMGIINFSILPKPRIKGSLITSGIYKITKHPIYLGLLLISFGILINDISIYKLILTISLLIVISIKIIIEEKYLINKYTAYKSYKKKVRF